MASKLILNGLSSNSSDEASEGEEVPREKQQVVGKKSTSVPTLALNGSSHQILKKPSTQSDLKSRRPV